MLPSQMSELCFYLSKRQKTEPLSRSNPCPPAKLSIILLTNSHHMLTPLFCCGWTSRHDVCNRSCRVTDRSQTAPMRERSQQTGSRMNAFYILWCIKVLKRSEGRCWIFHKGRFLSLTAGAFIRHWCSKSWWFGLLKWMLCALSFRKYINLLFTLVLLEPILIVFKGNWQYKYFFNLSFTLLSNFIIPLYLIKIVDFSKSTGCWFGGMLRCFHF